MLLNRMLLGAIGVCHFIFVSMMFAVMEKDAKIYVAGHRGLVGSAIVRGLTAQGYSNIIVRSSAELDLRNQQAVNDFFAQERPEYVFLAAAKVGGIHANNVYTRMPSTMTTDSINYITVTYCYSLHNTHTNI